MAESNNFPVVFRVFRFSKIITDIKPKYIRKWAILSKCGILLKKDGSSFSVPDRLRYIIKIATLKEKKFFLIIF
jgi:hypothetical protein